jgi:hypothetical protein
VLAELAVLRGASNQRFSARDYSVNEDRLCIAVDPSARFAIGNALTNQRSVIRQRFSYRQTFALCRAKRHTPGTSGKLSRRPVLSVSAVGSQEPYLAVREHIYETP